MKKLFALLFAVLLLAGSARATEAFDPEPWEAVPALQTVEDLALSVPSAVLMEKETGQVLYELNAHDRLPPASVTKVMTMLLVMGALEAGQLAMEDEVSASAHASEMGGSQIFLKEGERMTVRDLLKSVAVASANDAAVALAEHIAGSEAAFVARMNARAAELGMKDTVFANCTGLPAEGEHLTTAWDIALMSRELLGHEAIKKFTTIWTDTVRGGEFGISNTNKLIRFYEGATGLKTGFTAEAMYCVSATAEREGVEYIAVVMHGETSAARFESAKVLLNYAFANFTLLSALPDEALPPVPVELGRASAAQPVPAETPRLLLRRSEAAGVTKTVELAEGLTAPVSEGQELGRLVLRSADGAELAAVPLVAAETVERLSWWELFLRVLRLLGMAGG
jgi:D-alanyl-D-alanine carboxypeptidase (penicillin-binding protein 5/6)